MTGVEKAINSDRFPERLEMAKKFAKAEVINSEEVNAGEALKEKIGGRGLDASIDAVRLEGYHMFQQKKNNCIKVVLKP